MAGSLKKINASGAVDLGEMGRVVTQLQANVGEALTPLQNKPILDGIMLSKLEIVSGSNLVQHKLGRKVVGYFVISQSAASQFYDNIQTNTSASSFSITATSPCNVNLWVF